MAIDEYPSILTHIPIPYFVAPVPSVYFSSVAITLWSVSDTPNKLAFNDSQVTLVAPDITLPFSDTVSNVI